MTTNNDGPILYYVERAPKRNREDVEEATLAAKVAASGPDTRATYGYL